MPFLKADEDGDLLVKRQGGFGSSGFGGEK